MDIILAAAVVGGVGLLMGLFLGVASEKFKVEVDEREVEVRAQLPGNNCGGCGFPGCDGLAAAIVKKEAPVGGCPVGGSAVAAKIAAIMGEEASDSVRKTAFVKCKGDCEKAGTLYEYYGVEDCAAASQMQNKGQKICTYGCLGFGSCKKACPFGAIEIIDGIAKVDKEKCKACGKCVAACPKHLIELIPYDSKYAVQCSSHDKGPVVKKSCSAGCIGCTLCTKQCETGAITVDGFLAHIDYDKCTGCGKCAEKCPAKVIEMQNK